MSEVRASSRVRARVEGTVQGVGFRPYVYRLAGELGVAGHVLNDSRGVVVEVEAAPETVERFLERLAAEAPPLARVERVVAEPLEDDRRARLRDPREPARRRAARRGRARQRHLRRLPAPSCSTPPTAAFATRSPTAPTAGRASRSSATSPTTGRTPRWPASRCARPAGRVRGSRRPPLPRTAQRLSRVRPARDARARRGEPAAGARPATASRPPRGRCSTGPIVAVKGLGGFHLACRAGDEAAVARAARAQAPRGQAVRPDGPRLDGRARAGASWSRPRRELLRAPRAADRARAPAAGGAAWPAAVAPASADLGVMLPYSPLHHLLLADVGEPLVMTSGNTSDEPIAYRDDDARERLAGIADLFLAARPADRDAHRRLGGARWRPARPAAAAPLARLRAGGACALPVACRAPLLACGAELKNTFGVAKGGRAWVGHHIGDLENWETLRSFTRGHRALPAAVRRGARGGGARPPPRVPVHQARAGAARACSLVGVQHHHAHLAACLAEHGEHGPRGGRHLRRHGLRRRRHGLGRRAAAGRPVRLRARGHALSRAAARRRRGGQAAVADGLRVARRGAWQRRRARPRALSGA